MKSLWSDMFVFLIESTLNEGFESFKPYNVSLHENYLRIVYGGKVVLATEYAKDYLNSHWRYEARKACLLVVETIFNDNLHTMDNK